MSKNVEKQSLLSEDDGEGNLEIVKRNVYLLVITLLLAAGVGLVAAQIAMNTRDMVDNQNRREAVKVAVASGNSLVGIADEVSQRLDGRVTYFSPALSAGITTLLQSPLTNVTYQIALASAFAAARTNNTLSVPALMAVYNNLITRILPLSYASIAAGANTPSRLHLGLLCLGSHVTRISTHFIYLSDFIRPNWDPQTYIDFVGVLDNEPCAQLIGETKIDVEENTLIGETPGLMGVTPFSFLSISADHNAKDLQVRMSMFSQLFLSLSSGSLDQYDRDVKQAIWSLAFSCTALFVLVVLMIAAPFVSNNMDAARSDIRSVFRQIEVTVKLISKYCQVLQTCSVRDSDWAMHQAHDKGFLWRVVTFVQQIRPYIPQSSFGDIENVPITGQSNNARGSMRMDTASAAQAIRELRLRDLRPDMGMQIVSGTVMSLSLAAFHKESDAIGDASVQDAVCDRFASFLSTVENCINGTTGVIHTLAGDHLVALWNVTSSTSVPHVCAVHSALQLIKALGNSELNISMGVSQSFLLAGNVDIGKRKQLVVCGPAVSLAERLESCNAAHKSNLMIDQSCAEAIANAVIADFDFTVRPVVLLRLKDDADDYVTGFAVSSFRIRQEKLKAWNTLFKEMTTKLHAGAFAEALLEVEEYKSKHANEAHQAATGKQRNRNLVDRSAESWKRNLMAAIRLKDSSQRHATEFGV